MPPFTRTHIAPCGMNCGICYAHLREKNPCPGCRSEAEPIYKTINECVMRNCTERNGDDCTSCDEFPCKKEKHFDKRYRTKYGMSPVDNLNHIKDHGIRDFLKSEAARWICDDCGGIINVHKWSCSECGSPRE